MLYFGAFLCFFPLILLRNPPGESLSLSLSETYVNLNTVLMTYCIKPCNNSFQKTSCSYGSFFFFIHPPPSHSIFLSICSSVLTPLFFSILLTLTLTVSFHLNPPILLPHALLLFSTPVGIQALPQ